MNYLRHINESIKNFDCGFNFPTLVICAPVISLLVQRVQVAAKIAKIEGTFSSDLFENGPQYKKLIGDYKWHFIGSSLQAGMFSTLMFSRSPWFAIPFLIAAYQAGISVVRIVGGINYSLTEGRSGQSLKLRISFLGI